MSHCYVSSTWPLPILNCIIKPIVTDLLYIHYSFWHVIYKQNWCYCCFCSGGSKRSRRRAAARQQTLRCTQHRRPPRSKDARKRHGQFLSAARRTFAGDASLDTPGPGAYDGMANQRSRGVAPIRDSRFHHEMLKGPGPADYEVNIVIVSYYCIVVVVVVSIV